MRLARVMPSHQIRKNSDMFKAPLSIICISQVHAPISENGPAWARLQAALGDGIATVKMETPERRASWPNWSGFRANKSAPPADLGAAKSAFTDLVGEWHFAFETILNRRWDLYDNTHSKAWLLPGAILLHEDPLGYSIDNCAEDIAARRPLEQAPTWALLIPTPESNHAAASANAAFILPHAEILNKALTKAARSEGHEEISPLEWDLQTLDINNLDIVEA